MTDQFDPRLIQAEYLGGAGFRDHLVARLRALWKLDQPSYEFSKENESERVDANIWLIDILAATGFVRSDVTKQWTDLMILRSATADGLRKRVNLLIAHYGLGEPVEPEELQ